MESLDYRFFLREELESRRKRNPAYSARALARDLDLSAPFLSQVFTGARLLGEERANHICRKLNWSKWKRAAFLSLVRYQSVQDLRLREDILNDVKAHLLKVRSKKDRARFHKMQNDEFKLISDWYHQAIYELAGMKALNNDAKEISQRLGITIEEATSAVERLIQVGHLEMQNGQLQKAKGHRMMGAIPSAAIRSFHRQHLEKARHALDRHEPRSRDITGTTMAIDIKKLPRAKALIRKFQQELMSLLESGRPTSVYHLAIQLYSLEAHEETHK